MSMSSIIKGVSGQPELTRIIGASAAVLYPFPYIWDVISKGVVPEPSSFGNGYAAVLLAVGGMIGVKEFAVGKAKAAAAPTAQPGDGQ